MQDFAGSVIIGVAGSLYSVLEAAGSGDQSKWLTRHVVVPLFHSAAPHFGAIS